MTELVTTHQEYYVVDVKERIDEYNVEHTREIVTWATGLVCD